MNPLLLLKWWRELSLAALAFLFLSAAHSCSSAKEEVARIKAEDSALAENQRRQNEQKARADKQAFEDSLHDYQDQIAHLRDDTRVAHLVCPRASSPRPVSAKTESAPGASTEASAQFSGSSSALVGRDYGPAISQLMREADEELVKCNALRDWVNATR